MKIRGFFLIALLALAIYLVQQEQKKSEDQPTSNKQIETTQEPGASVSRTLPVESKIQTQEAAPKTIVISSEIPTPSKDEKSTRTIPTLIEFTIDPDGWAIAYGDVLLGVPPPGTKIKVGLAKPQPLSLWESGEIPFHIPKDFPNPERILEALEYFKGTPINFVTFSGQLDAIIFESKPGHCRSYLGKIGGLQPILLDKGCQPKEIAHEIMHALGFIHEHSRTDRDDYVEVLWNNIDEKYKSQFTLVPESLMEPLRDFNFDYQSIMIYGPKTFAKQSSLETLKSKNETPIESTSGLSPQDVERLNKIY